MNAISRICIAAACALISFATYAQPGAITVIKGVDGIASNANNVPDTSPCFNALSHFTIDNNGNYYTYNAGNSTIRKVDAITHLVTTIAGTGTSGYSGDGGPADLAQISGNVAGIVTDDTGNIIFIDNDKIRKISIATGNIYTLLFLGTEYTNDICIDRHNNIFTCHSNNNYVKKYNPVTGAQTVLAMVPAPYRITNDTAGNIYSICNGRVIKITSSGDTSWIAGRGSSSYYSGDGGSAREANLYSACAIQVDDSGNIYIIDRPNAGLGFHSPVIRKIDAATGMIHKVGFGIAYDDADLGTEPRPYLEYSGGSDITFQRLSTGQFLINTGACIKQLAHEYCPIDSIYAMDTLLSPPGELATYGIYISGTLKGRPSAGDGYIEIKADFGGGVVGGFLMPYYPVVDGTSGDTVYHFGDTHYLGPHFFMNFYHYTMPGVYYPRILFTSVNGYRGFVGFPPLRVGTNDVTTTRALHITNIDDSITSEPCIFPATVTRSIKGYVIASSLNAADSVYAEVDNDDGTSEILVRKLQGPGTWPGETTWTTASDSIYYFNITYDHLYAARYASAYDPMNPAYGYNCKVHAVTNSATGDDLEFKTGNIASHYFSEFQCQGSCNTTHVLSCDIDEITNIAVYSIHDSVITPCGIPATTSCTVKGFVAGYVSATDSVFLEITNGNDSIVAAIMIPINGEVRAGVDIPYAELYDSVRLFSYTYTGPFGGSAYNTYGDWPTGVNAYHGSRIVTVRTNTGVTADPMDAEWLGDGLLIESCDRNYVNAFSSYSDYGDLVCANTVPFTGNFFFQGYVQGDLAATSVPSFPVYFNLGDGFDTVIIANSWAEGSSSPGVFSIGFDHSYTIPGHYVVTAYIDTSIVPMRLQEISHDELDITAPCSPVSGTFFIDNNYNCIADTSETKLAYWPFLLVNNTTGDTTNQWCDAAGNYNIGVTVGNNYTIIGTHPSYFDGESASDSFTAVCPSSGTFSFDAVAGVPAVQNFGLNCASIAANVDMTVSGWASNIIPARRGNITITAGNGWGYTCDSLHATVTLIKDHRLTYAGMWSGSPLPDNISGDTLTWGFSTVNGLFEFNASIKVICDTFATATDSMHNTVTVSSTFHPDPLMTNNTYSWATRVRTSYDPNEKEVSPKGFGAEGYVENGTPLAYIIHFQNTGSADAENVTVVDSLNSNLDMATLQIINSSADVVVYQEGSNIVKFRLNNINLPDSASNPEGSKGFVSFNILPKDNLTPGTRIENFAKIFFDYNPAIVTNTTLNTIEDTIHTISGLSSVCVGAQITLSNAVAGGVWTVSNTNASVSLDGVITGLHSGIDTVFYTVYGDKVVHKIISIDQLTDAGTIEGAGSVCVAATATLSNTAAGGTWSSTPEVTVSGGVVTGITAGTAIITYSVANGCGTAIDTMLFTVKPLADAGTITGTPSVCTATTTTLSNAVAGGTWSSSSNSTAMVIGGVVTGVSAGTAIISYSVTGDCGTVSDTMQVVVSTTPALATITGNSTVCATATTTLTTDIAGGTWSSSTTSATVAGGVVTGVAAGATTISYSFTNNCGTTTATQAMTVNPQPDAGTITGTPSVCPAATTTLTNTVAGGTWSANNSNATVASGFVTGATAGTTIISYSLTNTCGTAVDTMLVTVNPLPDAGTITGTPSVCSAATTTLNNATSGGTWSSSSSAATVADGVVTGATTGTAIISYSITNTCGTATDTMLVTVNPLPDAGTITGTPSVCPTATTTLSNVATGGTWTSSSSSATVTGGVVTGVSAGSSLISYSVTNMCGTAFDTMQITINPLPDAGIITGIPSVCPSATTTLTNAITGGTWSSSTSSTTVTDGVVTGAAAGTAIISYSVTNMCGTATDTMLLTVNPLPDAGSITGIPSVCPSATTTLTNTVTGGSWSSGSSSATVIDGVVTGTSAGTAIISYSVTNMCGTAIDTIEMVILPLPDAGIITGTGIVCIGAEITLSASVPGGSWSSSNANTSVSDSVVSGISEGASVIMYTVMNSCGTATDTMSVGVSPAASAGSISGASSLCISASDIFTSTATGGTWTTQNGHVAVSATGNVTALSAGFDTVLYIVTSFCGIDTASLSINVLTAPYAGTILGTDSLCEGGAMILTESVGGGVWSSSAPASATINSSGLVSAVASGPTTISYIVSNSCGADTATYSVYIVSAADCYAGISNTQAQPITIYPNPSSGTFTVQIPGAVSNATITVTDVSGKVLQVLHPQPGQHLTQVSLTNMASGTYMVKVEADGLQYRDKLVLW